MVSSRGDYHKSYNTEIFVAWFKKLLDLLGREKYLIIMDNARYHTALPPEAFRPEDHTTEEVRAYLRQNNVQFDRSAQKPQLSKLARKHVHEHVDPIVVQLARAKGHSVLFTPPRCSEFQPIEKIWAYVKARVARLFDIDTTFEKVGERLDWEFRRLVGKSAQVHATISHVLDHVIPRYKAPDRVEVVRPAQDEGAEEDDSDEEILQELRARAEESEAALACVWRSNAVQYADMDKDDEQRRIDGDDSDSEDDEIFGDNF